MNHNIRNVIEQIQPLRDKLKNHELYESLKSIDDIKFLWRLMFMQYGISCPF